MSRHRRRWGLILAGWALGVATFALPGAVLMSGAYDATGSPHPPLVGWATHFTMINSVRLRALRTAAPAAVTPSRAAAGFALYETHCVACHGGPGVARQAWTNGLVPDPPYLIDAARRWSPRQLHLIVSDGIKMTAMPAWRLVLTDSQTQDLVAFLEVLPSLTPADYARMRAAEAKAAAPPSPARLSPPPSPAR